MTHSDIIALYRDAKTAAQALGISRPCLSQWKNNGINMGRQRFIELITGGKLKAHKRHAPRTRA